MKKTYKVIIGMTFCMSVFVGCGDDEPIVDTQEQLKQEVMETYANIVYASYVDSYNEAVKLQTAITAFLAEPSSTTKFEAAKQAWLDSREPYLQTEAYRFASGPIDDEDGPEGFLNAWPLDEAYIDYVEGNSTAGIINDPNSFPTISKDVLESLNEQGGEENISIGYHAIEFLLWGQDLTDPSAKMPGQRPNTDFVDQGTASNQDRRRKYMEVCASLLLDHLQLMVDEWNPDNSGNYRETFLALNSSTALKNILTGIGVLSKSELAGERIFTAYDNRDQEDEHSCFSDNTHRDTRQDAQGVKNVYLGSYTRVDDTVVSGKGLHDLMEELNPELATSILAQLNLAFDKVDAVGIPFDNAINDDTERPKIIEAVNELRTLGDNFAAVATVLGFNINTGLPD
ncbi:imelysin family protein [Reichenbachiella sp. MALMAid0571]|uniref:imelysin family protein n=1 Tax=Reichenbachiella sp. MALMAid0571 TaxID=3143939 RepID=UPI0032E01DC7